MDRADQFSEPKQDRTGKRLNQEELLYIAELKQTGRSTNEIADAVCKTFGRSSLENSTVWRSYTKLPQLTSEDMAWEWEKMDEWRIPWDASRVLMDCWSFWTEAEAREPYPRQFTFRLAKWCYRVNSVYPAAPLYMQIRWATDYSRAELARDVLGREIDTRDLTEYLAFLPDESEDRYIRYWQLVNQGVLKGQPLGPDERGELELDAELYPDDATIPQSIQAYDESMEEIERSNESLREARQKELQRRKAIAAENWEKMGRPQVITPAMHSHLLPGETPSFMDFLIMPVQNFSLIEEEEAPSELC